MTPRTAPAPLAIVDPPPMPADADPTSPAGITFGQALPDGISLVATHITQGLAVMQETRELIKERMSMERDYARQLDALHRRHAAKLDKKVRELSVGASAAPTYQGAISSGMAAWNEAVIALDHVSRERAVLADRLGSEVSDKLKLAINQVEDARKKHLTFASRLIAEQDKVESDLEKAKIKYLQTCEDAESAKLRAEKADDKTLEKYNKLRHQTVLEMQNAKNSYIIAIAVTNSARHQYAREQVPWILDELEILETSRLATFQTLLKQYATCELETLGHNQAALKLAESVAASIDPRADASLFRIANASEWPDVPEAGFVGTSLWKDMPDMVSDDFCKVVLTNQRAKNLAKQTELAGQFDADRKRVDGLLRLIAAYTENPSLGNPTAVRDEYLECQRKLVVIQAAARKIDAELQMLTTVIGADDSSAPKPHAYKPASFKLPASCGCCSGSIWGRQALVCKDCGFACHLKCELKVVASCSGTRADGSTVPPSSSSFSLTSDGSGGGSTLLMRSPSKASTATASGPPHQQQQASKRASVASTAPSIANTIIAPSVSTAGGGRNSSFLADLPDMGEGLDFSFGSGFDVLGGSGRGLVGVGGAPTAAATAVVPAPPAYTLTASAPSSPPRATVVPSLTPSPAATRSSGGGGASNTVLVSVLAASMLPPNNSPALHHAAASPQSSSSRGARAGSGASDDGGGSSGADWSSATVTPSAVVGTGGRASMEKSGSVVTDPRTVPRAIPATTTRYAIVQYDYDPAGPDEVAVRKGQLVRVGDPAADDDEGWSRVHCAGGDGGGNGLVPSSYILVMDRFDVSKPHAQVTYAYTAQADGELTVDEGDIVQVVEFSSDGTMAADGWIDVVVQGSDRRGAVPASYVTPLQVDGL
ncbi:hypothetical protein BC828DRAFT_377620 [Blastocladiella britannica]|nr:hypothetical protein BC828DRAFT_377620 [Blastocladiella britannica]